MSKIKDLMRITSIFSSANRVDLSIPPYVSSEDICYEVTKEEYDFAEILFETSVQIEVKVGKDEIRTDGALIPFSRGCMGDRYFLIIPGSAINEYVLGRDILYHMSTYLDKGESE